MIEKHKLYGGEITLCFDTEKHIYSVDNNIVYGVTSIIGILDKPALIYWAVGKALEYIDSNLKVGATIDELNKLTLLKEAKTAHKKTSAAAADIGTLVHKWLETYLKAGLKKQPLPELPVNPQLRKSIGAFFKWVKKNKVKFITSERKIYSKKYGYAGTLDAEAKVNGKLCLIDFKTSSGVYNEYFLQASAYLKAAREETKGKYEKMYVIRIPKDGTVFEAVADNKIDLHFKGFLGCLQVYKWKMACKKVEVEQYLINLKNGTT